MRSSVKSRHANLCLLCSRHPGKNWANGPTGHWQKHSCVALGRRFGATLKSARLPPSPQLLSMKDCYKLLLFVCALYIFLCVMSDSNNVTVNIGGKSVPLNKINKPHNVVVGGLDKPIPKAEDFPEVEPEAREREARLAEERAKKSN
ncbi:hypothetical protein EJF18_30591 [Clavispora lusitaniae]|uniref:Uncharacterized protein n=1 Tax=Clavispora lusitaniae TaxID=36911 RepID=A0ACD0WJX1_CLALS|nr:hypothetical protein E0198_002530 [Clavispora lusitaniae]QFZ27613.1 hypothetical protein EJF14_30591 [Clavispora lusitaniae]QFZ33080.1 hypothetical protein EJF16_30591 [Clavispora lusitaniae]QFZ38750.1 hypothetical protein EJF15_30591 [Clavispora lusitaniae]QFZ44432.1 hypothetical protein EJF18_30591 [Clavispora lusitaniae]